MKNDKYRIDSHKLNYHIHRVSDWLGKKNIYPIYMEISPSGICNHRCVFCSVDFMGYQKRFINAGIFKERLKEFGRLGVKSIMYAGEGEPFLHKEFADIITHTKQAGIDVAITTNGVLMKSGVAEQILGNTKWIKVSCNAGTADTYGKIHRTKAGDFDKVIDNLRHYVLIRKKHCFTCTLGIQLLLLPENEKEVEELAVIAREIGLDYLVVKPYTHHYRNRHKFKMQYQQFTYLETNLQKYATDTFCIIFRANTMRKWDEQQRDYDRCLSLPFWSYIDAGGNVWGCSAHLQDERFLYGNINEQKFQEIWEGEKRLRSLILVEKHLDIASCKINCRMDEVNRYLWDLINPPEHVNFI